MNSYLDRYDEAQPHREKGFRWGFIAMGVGAPVVALWPINRAVTDETWSIVLACLSMAGLAFQLFALGRSIVCHRRANKIMDRVPS